MTYKWKTPYNAKPTAGKSDFEPSETIQGQSLSISQMLARINNGMPLEYRAGEYYNETTPQPRITDLTDYDLIKNEVEYLTNKNRAQQPLNQPLKESAENTIEKIDQ